MNPSRIRYWGLHDQTPQRLSSGDGLQAVFSVGEALPLVQALRRPVLEASPEGEAARSQHFLDFVERLAAQIRRLEQLGLGALDQVADVIDVLGLQAVG